ncbi:hypothetical protein [Sinorhizobium meliloti]|uniref:hypothetical protein n=1 Tax=Rhizobium meliloti TaxID=382 RepID=UPI001F457540|nr:hypothetical protein [Sinorhizobium meliloti]
MTTITVDDALDRAGTGAYQRRLMAIFGLVWAADAMQVLAVGFTAASIAATFNLTVPQALQTGTLFFLGCCSAPRVSAGSRTGSAAGAS